MKALHDTQNLAQTRSGLFWVALVFIIVVFFFVDAHDLFWSVREESDLSEISAQVEEGSPTRRMGFFLLGFFGVFGLLRGGYKRRLSGGLLGWLMIFFLFWAFLSLAWTEDIVLTSRRLMILVLFCLGALAVARNFSPREIILMVFLITGAYLAIGLAAEVVLRTFLPLDPDYRFTGALHPNQQGTNCALLLLSALFLAKDLGRIPRVLVLATAVAAVVFLVLTKSRTSFAAGVLVLFAYWSLVVTGRQKTFLVLVTGIVFTLLLLFFGDAVFHHLAQSALLGRGDDPDSVSMLTGRIPVWKDCVEFIARQPLQGYGYGAFWTPRHIFEISPWPEWAVADAHSAYLEVTLGLGLLGAVTYVAILFLGICRGFASGQVLERSGYRFLGVLLLFGALDGLLESTTVAPSLLYFLSVVALIYLGFGRTGPVGPDEKDISWA